MGNYLFYCNKYKRDCWRKISKPIMKFVWLFEKRMFANCFVVLSWPLAKIKCSICSFQCENWKCTYWVHHFHLNFFSWAGCFSSILETTSASVFCIALSHWDAYRPFVIELVVEETGEIWLMIAFLKLTETRLWNGIIKKNTFITFDILFFQTWKCSFCIEFSICERNI